VTEGSSDTQLRPFSVACDRCGTVLVGQIRREEAGKMVVVQLPHLDGSGRSCPGRGRGIPAWPLRLELRTVAGGLELVVGGGGPIAFASRETLGLERGGVSRELSLACQSPSTCPSADVSREAVTWTENSERAPIVAPVAVNKGEAAGRKKAAFPKLTADEARAALR
jgi:hypothetical protein